MWHVLSDDSNNATQESFVKGTISLYFVIVYKRLSLDILWHEQNDRYFTNIIIFKNARFPYVCLTFQLQVN